MIKTIRLTNELSRLERPRWERRQSQEAGQLYDRRHVAGVVHRRVKQRQPHTEAKAAVRRAADPQRASRAKHHRQGPGDAERRQDEVEGFQEVEGAEEAPAVVPGLEDDGQEEEPGFEVRTCGEDQAGGPPGSVDRLQGAAAAGRILREHEEASKQLVLERSQGRSGQGFEPRRH